MKNYSNEVLIVCLSVVLPVIFATIHTFVIADGFDVSTFGVALAVWTVFWGIGIRLFTTGMRQIIQNTNLVARDTAFANSAIGLVGIISLWLTHWIPVVALIGGLFIALRATRYRTVKKRNTKGKLVFISDVFIAVVTLLFAIGTLVAEIAVRTSS